MNHVATLLLVSSMAFAGTPVITELQPRGAERGKPFTLTVVGRDLTDGAKITSTMPASFTLLVPPATQSVTPDSPAGLFTTPSATSEMPTGRSAAFLVEPKGDIAPGVYPIRLETPAGISNILLFTVGTFQEKTEEESARYSAPNRNDSIETAEPVQSTPITINGTLRGAERDLYRVFGKAGEKRVFEVEARRCGSAIDPVLRILDGSGKLLARSEDTPGTGLDARLEFTFPRETYYYVEVHDARFSRQVQNFYRLKMGSYPYADGLFPLGGRRGASAEVSLFGGNLPAAVKAVVDLRNTTPDTSTAAVAIPNSSAIPLPFAVSDLPELIEPATEIPIPSVINGRLIEAGESDRYKFKVQPGEKLLFEIQARELGTSRLEAILTAFDANGKKIDSAGDKPVPEDVFAVQGSSRTSNDPFLNLTVPDGVNEITVAVEDLAQRGGPNYAYRLVARKLAQDFQLTLVSPYVNVPAGGTATVIVMADRRGYNGPINLSIANLPEGIHVRGGMIPTEYVDPKNVRTTSSRRGVLVLSADPGVEMPAREVFVEGEAKMTDGTVMRRRARGPAMAVEVAGATAQGVVDRQRLVTAPWLGLDLPVAIAPPPPASLEVKQVKLTRMAEGDVYDFEYRWNLRNRDAQLPEDLTVEIVGARDVRMTNSKRGDLDKTSGVAAGSFTVSTTKATDPANYDMIVSGKLKTKGGDEEVAAQPLAFVVTEPSTRTDATPAN